jgi:hypothetical protein
LKIEITELIFFSLVLRCGQPKVLKFLGFFAEDIDVWGTMKPEFRLSSNKYFRKFQRASLFVLITLPLMISFNNCQKTSNMNSEITDDSNPFNGVIVNDPGLRIADGKETENPPTDTSGSLSKIAISYDLATAADQYIPDHQLELSLDQKNYSYFKPSENGNQPSAFDKSLIQKISPLNPYYLKFDNRFFLDYDFDAVKGTVLASSPDRFRASVLAVCKSDSVLPIDIAVSAVRSDRSIDLNPFSETILTHFMYFDPYDHFKLTELKFINTLINDNNRAVNHLSNSSIAIDYHFAQSQIAGETLFQADLLINGKSVPLDCQLAPDIADFLN